MNRTKGTELGRVVRLADSLVARLRGFMFRSRPTPGEGILLSPCRAVHMFGVMFPLDVIFIDDGGRVVEIYSGLQPMRRTRIHGSAEHALELPEGTIRRSGTEVGDRLLWTPVAEDVEGLAQSSHRENGTGPQKERQRS